MDEQTTKAQQILLDWKDYQLDKNSIAAGIYVAWERALKQNMTDLLVPKAAKPYYSAQLKKVIDWLVLPDDKFGNNPIQGRDAFLVAALKKAVYSLNKKLGEDMTQWQYGQEKYKHIYLKHPMSNALKTDMRDKLDVGPFPRGGNGYTVGSTGTRDNQPSGGSFRIIVDCADWDACLGTNTPGQSGNPDDEFYDNLFELWANDKFFPVFYSRKKVEKVMNKKIVLNPK